MRICFVKFLAKFKKFTHAVIARFCLAKLFQSILCLLLALSILRKAQIQLTFLKNIKHHSFLDYGFALRESVLHTDTTRFKKTARNDSAANFCVIYKKTPEFFANSVNF